MELNDLKIGCKVVFTGCTEEQANYRGHDNPTGILEPNQIYEVENFKISDSYTDIYLKGFSGKRFNSVCFEFAEMIPLLYNFDAGIEKVFGQLKELETDVNVMLEKCREECRILNNNKGMFSYIKGVRELTNFNKDLEKLRRKLAYAKLLLSD